MDFSKVLRKSAHKPTKGSPLKTGWELTVRLTPKASHAKIGGIAIDANGQAYLKVYVTAVPEDNKANKALLELLSKTFRIPKSRFHIISGLTDRQKVIWIEADVLTTT